MKFAMTLLASLLSLHAVAAQTLPSLQVVTPPLLAQATSKGYVDTALSGKVNIISGDVSGQTLKPDSGTLSRMFVPSRVVPEFCSATVATTPDSDGVSPGSACMQAAVTALCARLPAGGVLHLAPLRFIAHDVTVPCSIVFEGEGSGSVGLAPAEGGAAVPNGTTWDYSQSASFGLRFQPSGWPSVTHQQLIYAPRVSDINFYSSARTGTALQFYGINSGRAERLSFTGGASNNTLNAILVYGVYKFDLSNITGNYYSNVGSSYGGDGITIIGDMSGRSRTGGACILGDCSTRTDIVTLHNVDFIGTTTGSGVVLSGTVNTTMGEHISIENKEIALRVNCAVGFLNITYCPQFITFTDFQGEGAVNEPFYLQDFTEFQCISCFAIGNGASANHGVDAGLRNYTQSGGAGGGLRWIGGKIGNVGGSAAYIGVSDSKISDAVLIDANLANIGAAGVEYPSGVRHTESNNSYCTYLGALGPAMSGTLIDAAASQVNLVGNQYYGCSLTIVNNSTVGASAVVSTAIQGP